MKARCLNPNNPSFPLYGGRGVTVCERWRNSFDAFLADNGECPLGLEIDRWPNKRGNYEPGNVRWATDLQQARNTTANLDFTVRGFRGCLSELTEHFGVPYSRVKRRLYLGWPIETALFAPPCQRDSLGRFGSCPKGTLL